jgi:hypothetical protein
VLELSNYKKAKVLKQARAYLKQQVEEEKYYRSVAQSISEKGNIREKFNLVTNQVHTWFSARR